MLVCLSYVKSITVLQRTVCRKLMTVRIAINRENRGNYYDRNSHVYHTIPCCGE